MNGATPVAMDLENVTLEFAMRFTGNTYKEGTTTAITETENDYPDFWNKQVLLAFRDTRA